MNTEKLFRNGVKGKDGDGKRYRVLAILPEGVSVAEWDDDSERKVLKNGEYDVWTPPRTLFGSYKKGATWGELKKAAEQKQLPDDTEILIRREFALPWANYAYEDAIFTLGETQEGKKVIIVK